MGTVVSGSGPRGSRPKGDETLLYCGPPGGPTLWGEVGQDRLGGSAETGGGIDDGIGDGVRGGVRLGAERDCRRRRGGVSESEQVKWSTVEQGKGRMSMNLYLQRGTNTAGTKKQSKT